MYILYDEILFIVTVIEGHLGSYNFGWLGIKLLYKQLFCEISVEILPAFHWVFVLLFLRFQFLTWDRKSWTVRSERNEHPRWGKSVVKSFLLEDKPILLRTLSLFHNDYIFFRPTVWGGEERVIICFLQSYACGVAGSKTDESKNNESVRGKIHKCVGDFIFQQFLTLTLVQT